MGAPDFQIIRLHRDIAAPASAVVATDGLATYGGDAEMIFPGQANLPGAHPQLARIPGTLGGGIQLPTLAQHHGTGDDDDIPTPATGPGRHIGGNDRRPGATVPR